MKTFRSLILFSALLVALPSSGVAALPGLPKLPGLDKFQEMQKTADDKMKEVQKRTDQAGKVTKGITGLTLEEEIGIGDAVSIEIVSRFGGLWRDAGATRRVNLVGKVLGRFATRQDLDWRFGLLNSDAVNAFSAPGGRVFITRGLYNLAKDDDALGGILGHEIEHIDRRHAVKIIAAGQSIAGISEVLSERSKDFAKYDEYISSFTKLLLETGYGSETEFDADSHGRALARTTGYASGGLRGVLETLQKSGTGKSAETFSTHPPLDERLKRLPKDPPPPAPAEKGK